MPSEKPTILVVENEGDIRGLLQIALQGDYNVIFAPTVALAKKLIEERRDAIALVLTDWNIDGDKPEQTGAEVIWTARTAGIQRFVVITGRGDNLPEIEKHSPDAVALKPFDIMALKETIARLIGQPAEAKALAVGS
ncbi:MAG: response regulator [Candidatus Peregrinibacteria bacterium]